MADQERFAIVEYPHLWPQRCALCPSQSGPMVDTFSEYPDGGNIGRVYLCSNCLRDATRVMGWTSGKRLNELAEGMKDKTASDKALAEANEIAQDLIEQVKVKNTMLKSQEKTIEDLSGKIRTLELIAQNVRDTASQLL